MTARFSRRALANIRDIGAYLGAENPRAADALLARIRATAQVLEEHPFSGHGTDIRNVRVLTMPRDPYRIFYAVTRSGDVLVLHVRHTARRPVRNLR